MAKRMSLASPKLRLVVLAAALLCCVAVACGIFDSTGSPCVTDANCPGGQLCCSAVCERDCSSGSALVASVTVSTDYVPGYEVDQIIVSLDAVNRSVDVNVTNDLITPLAVGQFTELAPERQHELQVSLSLRGEIRARRRLIFSAFGDVTIPVYVTRSCEGRECGADQECEGGRCVSILCSGARPEECPPAVCSVNGDCASLGGCATAVCLGGVCLQKRDDGACTDEERCIPGTGCVPREIECDIENDCTDGVACTHERCEVGRCIITRDDSLCGVTRCDPTSLEADPQTGCTPEPCSADNCVPNPCEVAECSDNRCVRTRLCQGSEQCCDGVCAPSCSDPRPCAGKAAGTICRAAAGACDIAETCDGVSDTCPADGHVAPGTLCRDAAGVCDSAEYCTGTEAACPANLFASVDVVCRGSGGACDVAETCTGSSPACPPDGYASGVVCRAATDVCDVAEVCQGNSVACPANAYAPPSTQCRGAAGPCDLTEFCTGSTAACPADAYAGGAVCNPSTGPCDPAEICTGSSPACPTPVLAVAGTVCRGAAGACDAAEVCSGSSAACPADAKLPSGTECRASAGPCDPAEACNGANDCPTNIYSSGNVCRSSQGDCDLADTCSGSSPDCPDGRVTSGTVCRPAAGVCDIAEVCNGGVSCPADARSSAVCRAGGSFGCNPPEYCNGGVDCPPDVTAVADGTACNDPSDCTSQSTCQGGVCQTFYCSGSTRCCEEDHCVPNNQLCQ